MRRPGQFAHPRTSVALSHQIHAARWAISRGADEFSRSSPLHHRLFSGH